MVFSRKLVSRQLMMSPGPVAPTMRAAIDEKSTHASSRDEPSRAIRVLIVEDDSFSFLCLKSHFDQIGKSADSLGLPRLGFVLTHAVSAEDAWALCSCAPTCHLPCPPRPPAETTPRRRDHAPPARSTTVFEIVLVDLRLPGLSGVELARAYAEHIGSRASAPSSAPSERQARMSQTVFIACSSNARSRRGGS